MFRVWQTNVRLVIPNMCGYVHNYGCAGNRLAAFKAPFQTCMHNFLIRKTKCKPLSFSTIVTHFVNSLRCSTPNNNRTREIERFLSHRHANESTTLQNIKVCCNRCICVNFFLFCSILCLMCKCMPTRHRLLHYVQHVVIMIIVGVYVVLWTTIAVLCCKVIIFNERQTVHVFV